MAGGALLLDYILTAAVSLTAGVAAIASAFPTLWPYKVWVALGLLVVITLLNMRGLRESGTVLLLPVYLFLVAFIGMIFYGGISAISQGIPTPLTTTAPAAFEPLGILIIMHAFSAGCTALTGIESISNGVPAFQPPEWLNARKTLIFNGRINGNSFPW